MTPSPCSIFFFSRFVVHDIFFLDCFCARIFFWLLPNPPLKYLMVRPLDTYTLYKLYYFLYYKIYNLYIIIIIFKLVGALIENHK
jgi:hypothetical protein